MQPPPDLARALGSGAAVEAIQRLELALPRAVSEPSNNHKGQAFRGEGYKRLAHSLLLKFMPKRARITRTMLTKVWPTKNKMGKAYNCQACKGQAHENEALKKVATTRDRLTRVSVKGPGSQGAT